MSLAGMVAKALGEAIVASLAVGEAAKALARSSEAALLAAVKARRSWARRRRLSPDIARPCCPWLPKYGDSLRGALPRAFAAKGKAALAQTRRGLRS